MKKILFILGIVILILLGAVLGYFLFLKKTDSLVSPEMTTSTNSQFSFDILPSPAPSGEYNLLLLGQGDPSHEGSNLTDSIMVVHLNTNNKTASLIFIPRDLWVSLSGEPGKGVIKINEAYSKNGLKTAEQVVSFITDLPIQNAILIDFNGFAQILDSLGGIDVTVAGTFDDYYYPIKGKELEICDKSPEEVTALSATLSGFELEKQFPCRYEHLHFDAGKIHMNGATALKFTRSRHSLQDGSDYARGQRQQVILIGAKDKLLSLEALNNIDKFFNKFIHLVKTDLDLETTKAIAGLIINPKDYQINQVIPSEENVLTASRGPGGQFILLPKSGDGNWGDFRDFVKQ